jgi:hypothetical protein
VDPCRSSACEVSPARGSERERRRLYGGGFTTNRQAGPDALTMPYSCMPGWHSSFRKKLARRLTGPRTRRSKAERPSARFERRVDRCRAEDAPGPARPGSAPSTAGPSRSRPGPPACRDERLAPTRWLTWARSSVSSCCSSLETPAAGSRRLVSWCCCRERLLNSSLLLLELLRVAAAARSAVSESAPGIAPSGVERKKSALGAERAVLLKPPRGP